MNLDEGEIDVTGDEALRRAQLTKLAMETLVSAMVVMIYAKLLLSDDVKYRLRQRFRQWRTAFFGPPPLSEEQIQEAERQVIVEALRTVRNGQ
jgi:hypothetical protein